MSKKEVLEGIRGDVGYARRLTRAARQAAEKANDREGAELIREAEEKLEKAEERFDNM